MKGARSRRRKQRWVMQQLAILAMQGHRIDAFARARTWRRAFFGEEA